MELISGVEAELSARSYALTLQVVADHDAEIAVYRRWWAERRVDGVLVCDLRADDRRIPALEELQLPAVVIGGPGGTGELASVWSDDAAALIETVEYLVALGHRRIARVGGLPDLLHTEIRTDAFAAVVPAARPGRRGHRLVRLHRRGGWPGHPPAAQLRPAGPPRSSTTTT